MNYFARKSLWIFARCIVFASLFLFPMKTEIIAARAIFKRTILPSVRHGKISPVIESLLGIVFCRLRIIGLVVPAFFRRCAFGPTLLQVDLKKRTLEQRDDAVSAARSETKVK
jgi:hypothetical protein